MITTMDRAGRVVIPKRAREGAGLVAGEVEIDVVGTTVTISVPTAPLAEQDGLLMLSQGTGLDDEQVRELRLGLQR